MTSQIRAFGERLGLNRPEVQALVEHAERFPAAAAADLRLLAALAQKEGISLAQPEAFGVPNEMPQDGWLIGTVLRGQNPAGPAYLRRADLPGNLGLFGRSGSGKSTLAGILCECAISDSLCTIVFDFAGEYGYLARLFGPERLRLVRGRDFPLNPFENPMDSAFSNLEWIGALVGMFRECFFLRDGSCSVLTKLLGDLYRKCRIFDDGTRDYPNLAQVFRAILSSKFSLQSRHAGFTETLVSRFQWMVQTFPALNARRSPSPARLFDRSLVLDLSGFSPAEADLFANLFLLYLMAWLENRMPSEPRLLLVVEEAHLLLSRQKMGRYDLGEPSLLRLVRTGRKSGLAIALVDQSPSELPTPVLNLASRFIFQLSNFPCLRAASFSLGLSDEQQEEVGKLKIGQAVAGLASVSKPFKLQAAQMPSRLRLANQEHAERQRLALADLDHALDSENAVAILFNENQPDRNPAPAKFDDQGRPAAPTAPAVSGDLHKVLARVVENPYETVEQRCDGIRFDRAREFRARQALIRLGLMLETGDKVGKLQLFMPSRQAREWAEKLGLPVCRPAKSGPVHEFILRQVQSVLLRLPKVTLLGAGKGLPGLPLQPDLLLSVATGSELSRRVAVEISVSRKPADEAGKAEALQNAGMDGLAFVTHNKSSAKILRAHFAKLGVGAESGKSGREQDRLFSATAAKQMPVVVLDFETAVENLEVWNWVTGK